MVSVGIVSPVWHDDYYGRDLAGKQERTDMHWQGGGVT